MSSRPRYSVVYTDARDGVERTLNNTITGDPWSRLGKARETAVRAAGYDWTVTETVRVVNVTDGQVVLTAADLADST